MKEPEKPAQQHVFLIDGRPATDAEYKRIMGKSATPARKERATAPLHQKPFSLLK